MRFHTLAGLALSCLLFLCSDLTAQDMVVTQKNYTSFTYPSANNSEEINSLNTGSESHPELGYLYREAPCQECFEIISKRTSHSKYFVKKGTEGKYIYQQTSTDAMHYTDGGGVSRTIVSNLLPDPQGGLRYTADKQEFPVGIDLTASLTYVGKNGRRVQMNRNLQLVVIAPGGEETILGNINWNNYTAGDDGVYITDAWPGIDAEFQAGRGQLKSNFILKQPFPQYAGHKMVIRDQVALSQGLQVQLGNQPHTGSFDITDMNGITAFQVSAAVAYIEADIKTTMEHLPYVWQNNRLDIVVSDQWFNRTPSDYPVVIDPLLSATNSMNVSGSQYNAACFTNGCVQNLAVNVPAAVQVTDIRWSFNYIANGGCWMSEGAVDFLLGNCRSPNLPNFFWFCNLAAAGTCTGSNISIFNHISGCVPAPQCASYPMNFSMRLYRCYGSGTGCSNFCISAATPWTMTVEGRTVETATVSASTTICQGQSANISANGQFGVPGYTYTWSPGNLNGQNVSVSPASTTTYSVVITDQCGNTSTGTTTVNVTPNNNPGFTFTPASPCVGQTVTVTGLGNGPQASYDWTLPGSNNAVVNNTQSFTTAYNTPGTYTITLNYANGSCIFPSSQNITVNASSPPTVSITANPGNVICAGTPVTFTATPTNGGSNPGYQWQVNGLNAGTNSNTFTSNNLQNGDVVTVILTSNSPCANPVNATSNAITMTVTPNVTPSVSIVAVPGNSICAGTAVTFTATPTNGGSNPTYQWQLNGNNVGNNSNTYTNNNLQNGDVITVIMTSNAPCANPTTATSNTITMTVMPNVTPSVSIVANPGNVICAGTSVTFTATPTNGGSNPTYQWQLNGSNVGTNSNTYTNNNLQNGAVITVIITSNAPCANPATATSNSITMTVTPNVTPSVSIVANPGNVICAGTSVTFTATPTNGGSNPTYQWQLNGSNVGTNSNTYTNNNLTNGAVITVIITSNANCANPTTATSNSITMTVNPPLVPSVSITANPGNVICTGTSVTFTATPTNGGSNPTYQWQLNGSNVGTNSTTYTNNNLQNGDVITVIMTSNAPCTNPSTATSNSITMTVNQPVTASVNITAVPSGPICAGTSVTFTATATNGGNNPGYQWQINGVNAGTNSSTFTTSTLQNGDVVTVIMASNAACVSPANATSNAINMIVVPISNPSVIVTASPAGTICPGTSVTFTANITNGGTAPTYQWLINGVNAGSNTSTFTSGALQQGDIVTVTVTNTDPCSGPAATSSPITMQVFPPIQVTASADLNVCPGDLVTLTATASGGDPATYQYQWSPSGNGNSITFYAQNTVTYTVTLTDGCSQSASDQVAVVVDIPPVAAFGYYPPFITLSNQPVIFSNQSTGGATYQWLFGNGQISNDQNPENTYNNPGDYTVALIVSSPAGCRDTITAILVVEDDQTIFIPNAFSPNQDALNPDFRPYGNGLKAFSIEIFDRWGTRIFVSHPSQPGWHGKIGDNTDAPVGVYNYRITAVFLNNNEISMMGMVNLLR